jgi:hypothetical protein
VLYYTVRTPLLHSSAHLFHFSGETTEEKTARGIKNEANKVANLVKHDARSLQFKDFVIENEINFCCR